MNDQELQNYAQHLASLSYKKARAEVRKLDTSANLKYWRNAVKNEWHTVYELPKVGLKVTLVELPERETLEKSPKHMVPLLRVKPVYVEARVERLGK